MIYYLFQFDSEKLRKIEKKEKKNFIFLAERPTLGEKKKFSDERCSAVIFHDELLILVAFSR